MYAQLPAPLTSAMAGLPPASRVFTGREALLRDLVSALSPDATEAAPITVISGQPGVGKTELALQIAHRALRTQGWFDGGVLFADLAGYAAEPEHRLQPEKVLASFLRALAIGDVPVGTQDRAGMYSSVLGAWADEGRRVLVVVDNASDSADVRPLMPADPRIPVLVTSRHRLSDLPNATIVDLPVLEPEESVAFLRRTLIQSRGSGDRRIDAEPDAAVAVVRRCGHLPLALHIVAARLADSPGRPLADLASDLASAAHGPQADGGVLDQLQRGDIGVRAALDLSYDALPEDQAELLRLLPHALTVTDDHSASTGALAALADLPEHRAGLLTEALARAHLIEADAQYGRWLLHDLVRAYVDEKNARRPDAEGERVRALDRLRTHYLTRTREALSHLTPDTRPAPRFADRDAAGAWLELELESVADFVAQELSSTDGELRRHGLGLALDLGVYLFQEETPGRYGRYPRLAAAAMMYRAAVRAARAERDRHLELTALGRAGDALTGLGLFEEAIGVRTEAHELAASAEPRVRLEHGANLAGTLRLARRFEPAATAYRRALELTSEIGDRSRELELTRQLAVTLKASGDVDAAVLALLRARTMAREVGDHSIEAALWTTLGDILRETTDPGDDALRAYLGAWFACRNAGDRFGEADRLMTVVGLLKDRERLDEALMVCFRAREVLEETDGDPAREAALLGLRGDVLRGLGRYEEATTVYQEAMWRYEDAELPYRLFGPLKLMEGYRDAVERHLERTSEQLVPDKALAALRDFPGVREQAIRRNDDVLKALATMPFFRAALADTGYDSYGGVRPYDGDIGFLREMRDEHRRIGDRYGEARVLGYIGRNLSDAGRHDEALAPLTEAHIMLRELGDLRGECGLLFRLGGALGLQGRYEEAVAAYTRLADVANRLSRPDAEAIAWQLRGLTLLQTGDDDEEAADCCERALRYHQDRGDLSEAVRLLDQFADALRALDRPEEALVALSRALRMAQSAGNRSEEAFVLHRLGLTLHDAGRYDEAVGAHVLAARLARETGDKDGRWTAIRHLRQARDRLALTWWRSRVPYRRGRTGAGQGLFGRHPVKSIRYTLYRRWHLLALCAGALVATSVWRQLGVALLLGFGVGLADACQTARDRTACTRQTADSRVRTLFSRVKERWTRRRTVRRVKRRVKRFRQREHLSIKISSRRNDDDLPDRTRNTGGTHGGL
ncbi:tetratricopeptide repeat protein [Streptomyces pacificus]|uniref:Tetratricopeptide repeat protein n=1 Tax=Streptomyces pacificus TaxID=2705029 RepID=A0A6A0AYE4_9ACTN|nr:tetratricopeptide repeat protein [Streptomyces pacificus]